MAARHCPVWGEAKYAAGAAFDEGLALHARRLAVEHPVSHERLQLDAPLPATWRSLGIRD